MNFNIAEFQASYGQSDQITQSTLPEIVFSGKSNVGKSSLINKILNRKSIARVSAKPGKTATINFFKLKEAYFVDLPGYGYAKVSHDEKKRWAELVEGYFAQNRNISLVIQICDIRHSPTADDLSMINFLYENNYHFIIALTKMDKLKNSQRQRKIEKLKEELFEYEGILLYPCSSNDGKGIEEIKKNIEDSIVYDRGVSEKKRLYKITEGV